MAIALTDGNIYFLESDAANDTWITDHGDPDNIDLTSYTEGTEYCKLPLPRRIQKSFTTGIQVMDPGGGTSVQVNWQKKVYQVLAEGIETSVANANTVEKFFMTEAHTISDTTYKDYYLVCKFGTNSYIDFTDDSGNRKQYCKGAVLTGMCTWVQESPLTMVVSLQWRSIWGT